MVSNCSNYLLHEDNDYLGWCMAIFRHKLHLVKVVLSEEDSQFCKTVVYYQKGRFYYPILDRGRRATVFNVRKTVLRKLSPSHIPQAAPNLTQYPPVTLMPGEIADRLEDDGNSNIAENNLRAAQVFRRISSSLDGEEVFSESKDIEMDPERLKGEWVEREGAKGNWSYSQLRAENDESSLACVDNSRELQRHCNKY